VSRGPLETALSAISRRSMSAFEVATLLKRKGFARPDSDAAVKRLSELGYVDDARYAQAFIATRGRAKGFGPARIRGELARRGVAAAVIDVAMAEAAKEGPAGLDDAAPALEKLLRGRPAPADRRGRDRLRAALGRKGFGAAAIARAMAALSDREAGRSVERDEEE